MRIVIGNAFSVTMLENSRTVEFARARAKDIRNMLANIKDSAIHSIIGHPGTAEVFGRLLDIELSANREFYKLTEGDVLIVGSLNTRLPEGKVLTAEELAGIDVAWWVIQ